MEIHDTSNSVEQYKELIKLFAHYEESPSSKQRALTFAGASWHLVDWVKKEYYDNVHMRDFRATLYPRCEFLKVMHDLANTNKHKNLDKPKSKFKSFGQKRDSFSYQFSAEFESTTLLLEREDGTTIDFKLVAESVLSFWIEYFRNVLKIPNSELKIRMDDYFI